MEGYFFCRYRVFYFCGEEIDRLKKESTEKKLLPIEEKWSSHAKEILHALQSCDQKEKNFVGTLVLTAANINPVNGPILLGPCSLSRRDDAAPTALLPQCGKTTLTRFS